MVSWKNRKMEREKYIILGETERWKDKKDGKTETLKDRKMES